MKTQVLPGLNPYLDMLVELLLGYLSAGWVIIMFIGNFAALFLVFLGFIFWLSGWEATKGRRMVVGGLVLFLVMQWMAFSPPWHLLLSR